MPPLPVVWVSWRIYSIAKWGKVGNNGAKRLDLACVTVDIMLDRMVLVSWICLKYF